MLAIMGRKKIKASAQSSDESGTVRLPGDILKMIRDIARIEDIDLGDVVVSVIREPLKKRHIAAINLGLSQLSRAKEQYETSGK